MDCDPGLPPATGGVGATWATEAPNPEGPMRLKGPALSHTPRLCASTLLLFPLGKLRPRRLGLVKPRV